MFSINKYKPWSIFFKEKRLIYNNWKKITKNHDKIHYNK